MCYSWCRKLKTKFISLSLNLLEIKLSSCCVLSKSYYSVVIDLATCQSVHYLHNSVMGNFSNFCKGQRWFVCKRNYFRTHQCPIWWSNWWHFVLLCAGCVESLISTRLFYTPPPAPFTQIIYRSRRSLSTLLAAWRKRSPCANGTCLVWLNFEIWNFSMGMKRRNRC